MWLALLAGMVAASEPMDLPIIRTVPSGHDLHAKYFTGPFRTRVGARVPDQDLVSDWPHVTCYIEGGQALLWFWSTPSPPVS